MNNSCAALQPQELQWHPIELAPKDGTYVLVWPPTWNGGVMSCAKWDEDFVAKRPSPYWRRTDTTSATRCRDNQPTHFALIAGPR